VVAVTVCGTGTNFRSIFYLVHICHGASPSSPLHVSVTRARAPQASDTSSVCGSWPFFFRIAAVGSVTHGNTYSHQLTRPRALATLAQTQGLRREADVIVEERRKAAAAAATATGGGGGGGKPAKGTPRAAKKSLSARQEEAAKELHEVIVELADKIEIRGQFR
jgi:hypothetical protein